MINHREHGGHGGMNRLTLGFAICGMLVVKAVPQQSEAPKPKSGESFCVECEMKNKVKTPITALPLLTQDAEDVSPCVNDEGKPLQPKPDWFSATEVHLVRNTADLFVKAEHSCMYGAHIGPFWVLRKTPTGWKKIFKVRADGVDILQSRTNGNRDIKAVFFNAKNTWSSLFQFRNGEYRLTKR